MEKGRGEWTDTLPTDEVFTRKEYIEREAALSFPFANGLYDYENANLHFIKGCESYREWLEAIPAADVVTRDCYDRLLAENDELRKERPVVRCKDCKHAHMTYDGLCKYCDELIEHGVEEAVYLPGDYFCADGERKDGDGDV